ncbi:MAG: lytic transglycosylase domain-containing protein [Thalassobaculaceae bacterium]
MNRSEWIAVGSVLGLAALFAGMHRTAVAAGDVLSKERIRQMAAQVIARHGFDTTADVVANIAMIESSGNPAALRYEQFIPHLGRADYSTGLMQVLTSTAEWLARDMGYRFYGVNPTRDAMLDPWVSLYYGAAYLDYLARYPGGPHPIEWIVQSYNAGPGNSQSNYLRKYRAEATR